MGASRGYPKSASNRYTKLFLILRLAHCIFGMITVSKEDYLKTIAEAEAEGESVIAASLAHWLSVTRPAVTTALKRLARDQLVKVGKNGHIQLTAGGREIAERTIFRH